MLVGVVGLPQQNSILYHPSVKVGPYHDFYPSPPTHGRQENSPNSETETRSNRTKVNLFNYDALCRDPDIAMVMLSDSTWTYTSSDESGSKRFGWQPFADYVLHPNRNTALFPTTKSRLIAKRRAEAYLHAAIWYAVKRAGIPVNTLFSLDHVEKGEAFADHYSGKNDWKKVLAMRFVAHASSVLVSYYASGLLATGEYLGGYPDTDITIDGLELWKKSSDKDPATRDGDQYRIKLGNMTAWHEAALRMGVLHADAAGPYHWGASRPLNRQVNMDHPLVQLDLWSTPISGIFEFSRGTANAYPGGYSSGLGNHWPPYAINDQVTRRQWRACYPQPIEQPGLPKMFSGRYTDQNADGTVDYRDGPCATAGRIDYPPRILDANADGVLDHTDNNVPTSRVTSTLTPRLVPAGHSGLTDWNNYRTDLQTNGQPALGPASHFTLTAPFTPRERCRQMVFWACDWQSYEDFETHPSARIDANRYPLVAPHAIKGAAAATAWTAGYVQRTDYQRQMNAHNAAALIIPSGRNPELVSCFRMPSRVDASGYGSAAGGRNPKKIPTVGEINTFGGWDESDYFRGDAAGTSGGGPQAPDIRDTDQAANAPDAGGVNVGSVATAQQWLGHDLELWNPMIFLGRYGVNRDGIILEAAIDCMEATINTPLYPGRGKPSALVDGGPVPAAVRLRAISVARFNFYDPRVSGSLRY
jgi:hypothetical protein